MGWTTAPGGSQILAIHAALLHTGKILYFGGDEHDKTQHDTNQIDHTRCVDCATLQVGPPLPSPTTDVFCAGHAFLADGRLLVAGGTEAFPSTVPGLHHSGFRGLRDTWIFDPVANAWTPAAALIPEPGFEAQNTGGGRWYPTLTTLPNGRVLANSGEAGSTDTRQINDCCETFNPTPKPKGRWRRACKEDHQHDEHGATDHHALGTYPRMHLLPNGQVFCANAIQTGHGPPQNQSFNPGTRKWRDLCPALTDPLYEDIGTTSVLLPLLPADGYRPRILRCGAQQPMLLDLGAPTPAWQPTAARALAGSPVRRHACAVLLPTGDVLVSGGVVDQTDATAVLTPELYASATGTWSTLEPATIPRNYHSVALLMPDGRVWTAGSNKNAAQSFSPPVADNRELAMEIYAPAYVAASRPQITAAPPSARWLQKFVVQTPQAATIQRVALLRNGSVTHAFDFDQRYVDCAFSVNGPQEIRIKAPPSARIAPPGWYLLFLIDNQNVPSVGSFIRIGKIHP